MIYDRYLNEFSSLSSTQLNDVRRALDDAFESRKKQEIQALRDEFGKKANELGIDIKDLVGGRGGASRRAGKKVDPKYRMVAPDGTVHEWSGRGMKPKVFAPYTKEEMNARFAIRS